VSKRTIFAAACAIAMAAVAGSAMAQSEAAAARSIYRDTVPVTYGDLNLASADGATTMLQRLHDAALNACGADDSSLPDYKWATHRSACYHRSMDRAVADLGSPSVTQLYQAHSVYASN
jgi:UrcA family protein